MTETSVLWNGGLEEEITKTEQIEFVELKNYFPFSINDKNNEVLISIDNKLLKFNLNKKTGEMKYSSKLIIKPIKEGYKNVVQENDLLYLTCLENNLMEDKNKNYVWIWNKKNKKPESKLAFKRKVLETVIRNQFVVFVLENRFSFFKKNSYEHLLKTNFVLPEQPQQTQEMEKCVYVQSTEDNSQTIILLPKDNKGDIWYINFTETLDMQFDFYTRRKRESQTRRQSHIQQKRKTFMKSKIINDSLLSKEPPSLKIEKEDKGFPSTSSCIFSNSKNQSDLIEELNESSRLTAEQIKPPQELIFNKLNVFISNSIAEISVNKNKRLLFCVTNFGEEMRIFRFKDKPFLIHKISLGTVSKLWKKVFSYSIQSTFILTSDIILIMTKNYRFRLIDLGSVVNTNFKLFSSNDFVAFDFKPALESDFFFMWNQLNPFHREYDSQLAQIYDQMKKEIESNKEYDSEPHQNEKLTIIEESEEDDNDSHQAIANNERYLFSSPKIISSVEMDKNDPIEIKTVRIWIFHLDGFMYEVIYKKDIKELEVKDNPINWMRDFFKKMKIKKKKKKTIKNKIKLKEFANRDSLNGRDYSLNGDFSEIEKSKVSKNMISSKIDVVQSDKFNSNVEFDSGHKYRSEQRVNSKSSKSEEKRNEEFCSEVPSEVIYRNISNFTDSVTIDSQHFKKKSLLDKPKNFKKKSRESFSDKKSIKEMLEESMKESLRIAEEMSKNSAKTASVNSLNFDDIKHSDLLNDSTNQFVKKKTYHQ